MKAATIFRSDWLPCAGLIVPPLVWAVNTQLAEILPYAECGGPVRWSILASCSAALLSLTAGLVAWWTTRRNRSDADLGVTAYPVSFVFVGWLNLAMGAVFAYALALQGFAGFVLTGCER